MNQPWDGLAISTQSPLLSVMVPTYQPCEFLRDTLASIQRSLARAEISAEVQVVDDGSPSVNVAELISDWVERGTIAQTPVYRRPVNGGLSECWNTCILRARGQYIHVLHQDDLVEPDFYSRMLSAAFRYPQARMVFCRAMMMEGGAYRLDALEQPEAGVVDDWLVKICLGQRLQCATVIVHADVYRRVGGYASDLRYIVDWEMWIRIAASESVAYVPEALALYRIHDASESRRIKAAGVVTRDAARGMKRVRQTLQRAGRVECYPAVVGFCRSLSDFSAYQAECAGQWHLAAKERMFGIRYFGTLRRPLSLLRQVKAYLRAQLKAVVLTVGSES